MENETPTPPAERRALYMSNPYRVGCHMYITKTRQITVITKIDGDNVTTMHGTYLKTDLENIITASERLAIERWIEM
jgi:hypothetical protein